MKSFKQLLEKAVSQDQQQAAAIALSVKRGDAPKSILKGASKSMYKMSSGELKKFASTKHKNLPTKKEDVKETDLGHDDEAGMMMGDLYKIAEYASELHDMMMDLKQKGGYDFPHWCQSKIVIAAHIISAAYHYLEHELKMQNGESDVDDYGYEEYDGIDEDCDCK